MLSGPAPLTTGMISINRCYFPLFLVQRELLELGFGLEKHMFFLGGFPRKESRFLRLISYLWIIDFIHIASVNIFTYIYVYIYIYDYI